MSLPRNTPIYGEQEHTAPSLPPTTAELQQSLKGLWAQIESYRAETQERAADKYEMTLILATVCKLCEVQEDFMENVKSELTTTLNVQNEYKENVREEVGKILNHIYAQIEQRQEAAHNKMLEKTDKSLNKLKAKTDECFTDCSFVVETVKKSIAEMKKINSITDILLLLAPLSVIGSFILKLIELLG